MARIAILSDIHGNLPAFEAALKEMEKNRVDEIVFGGDVIGYGASPGRCVELVRRLSGHCVLGNHESFLFECVGKNPNRLSDEDANSPLWAALHHAAKQLSDDDVNWLRGLDWFIRLKGGVLAHASLNNPNAWEYLEDENTAAPTFSVMRDKSWNVGFFGHTHRQKFIPDPNTKIKPKQLSETRLHFPEGSTGIIMTGSIGQSREEGDYQASWAIWDTDERIVEFKKTEYPNLQAARDILEAGLPIQSALRLLPKEKRELLN